MIRHSRTNGIVEMADVFENTGSRNLLQFYSKSDQLIGQLEFTERGMTFQGEVNQSAFAFFQYLKNNIIDPYIQEQIQWRKLLKKSAKTYQNTSSRKGS